MEEWATAVGSTRHGGGALGRGLRRTAWGTLDDSTETPKSNNYCSVSDCLSPSASWVIEVKTGALRVADLRGLAEFTRRFPKYRPLLLCDPSDVPAAVRLGMPGMSWKQFLLGGKRGPLGG
jgi:hypothetical protein